MKSKKRFLFSIIFSVILVTITAVQAAGQENLPFMQEEALNETQDEHGGVPSDIDPDEDLFFYLEPDEQIFSEATLDEDFEDNAVVIVLNRASSRDDRTFTAMDFSDIGAVYVEDLDRLSDREYAYAEELWEAERNMVLAELSDSPESDEGLLEIQQAYLDIREEAEANTLVNFDEYRRILLIRLDQNSRENVLNVIQQLQGREYIHIAESNYIFEPDEMFEYGEIFNEGDILGSNAITPNDPDLRLQWAVNRLSLPQAWGITTGSTTVRVGIVGHGIEATHPELIGRVSALSCGSLVELNTGRNGGIGYGTRQAGIIGAMGNNGIGIAGIAWNVELVSVAAGTSHARGITAARDAQIPILTRSFGGVVHGMHANSSFYNAVRNYTGIFINSAGNDNQNTDSNPRLPGLPNAIIVGASNSNDGRSVFRDGASNYGSTSVHLFAPGTNIQTTAPNNLFDTYSGTSAAAPHVAGVAALILSVNPELSPQQVSDIILANVDPVPAFANISISGGRLNAYNAVRAASSVAVVTFDWNFDDAPIVDPVLVELGEAVTAENIPEAPEREGFVHSGWQIGGVGTTLTNGEVAEFEVEGSVNFIAVWTTATDTTCPIDAVAYGQFADQPGANGMAGARWCLWDDGRLEVHGGFINWTGSNNPWSMSNSPWVDHQSRINRIVFTGDITAGRSLSSLFSSLWNVTAIDGLEHFDTSQVEDMSWMFAGASRLTGLDLSGWNTSQVRDMSMMFMGVSSLTNLDLSDWNTSQVRNMSMMFMSATSLTELNVDWETSQVTDMSMMFAETRRLTKLDLSSWSTNQVTNMHAMFIITPYLREITFGEDFAFINSTFPGLPGIPRTDEYTGFWQNVGDGTVDNPMGEHVLTSAQLMNLSPMIADTWVWQRFSEQICPINTIERGQFANQPGANGIDGATWCLLDDGTLSVNGGFINWSSMGSPWQNYRSQITEIIFRDRIVAGSTLQGLFGTLENVTTIEGLEHFDTSQVVSMRFMFSAASSLTELDLSSWETGQVTDMGWMFINASSLTELNLSSWETEQVISMNMMFWGATALRQITIGEDFRFVDHPTLPEITRTDEFTGYWQNVGDGTVDNPLGNHVLTSAQLMDLSPMVADTWVWQPVRQEPIPAYDITRLSIGGVEGLINQGAQTIFYR